METRAQSANTSAPRPSGKPGVLGVFLAFLKLGLTAFGGPIAHLGYFRQEFVARRRWLDDDAYADLVALCQFLPGPASSQTGIGIGLMMAGLPGALAAWIGFTLPSAALMIAFGLGVGALNGPVSASVLHGLKVVAVAVVAQAVLAMARTLTPDAARRILAACAAAVALALPGTLTQLAVIVGGAVAGLLLLDPEPGVRRTSHVVPLTRGLAVAALAAFGLLLAGLPILALATLSQAVALADAFYRAGALVFGGGHVVLPLLEGAVVQPGWVSGDAFLAGYGAAQAVPGPLFTFAAYLGAVAGPAPNGLAGALIALLAIFAPGFLLVVGVLPFWGSVRQSQAAQRALKGVNAAVVGILVAALITPVGTSALTGPADALLAAGAFALLVAGGVAPWIVVALVPLATLLINTL